MPDARTAHRSAVGHVEEAIGEALDAADADDSDDPAPEDRTVPNLLPRDRRRPGPPPPPSSPAPCSAAAAVHFGRDLVLAPFCVFFAMLVAVSVTDLTHRLVPRRLIYGAWSSSCRCWWPPRPSTTPGTA